MIKEGNIHDNVYAPRRLHLSAGLVCTFLLFALSGMFSSCKQIAAYVEEMGESEFGVYKDSLDTLRMRHYLTEIIQCDTSHWKADVIIRHRYDSIANFDEMPLWFTGKGLSEDVVETADYLEEELPRNGLDVEAFNIPQIENDINVIKSLAFDSLGLDINEVLMRLDYNLSKAYTRYVTGIRYGFVRPAKIFNRLYKKEDNSYAYLYDYETAEPDYNETIGKLQTDQRMDYLKSSQPADNVVFRALQTELEHTTDKNVRQKISVNMERTRWRIKHPTHSENEVIVNIPSQHLWASRKGTLLDMKICCGAWDTKTPLLCSEIAYLQVNPEWSIPPKIVDSDFPRHAGDSSWFARHGYFVVNRKTGDTLNIAHISAEGMKNHGLRFVQRGGQNNSLGRIVFRFASKFSIYLHDTNSRWAFERDRRTISHGCIRVEKPFELACFLIPDMSEWTTECLRISMDIPPVTERGMKWIERHSGTPRPYRLLSYHKISPKVPLYIVYYTVFPNPHNGIVEELPDRYGYDKALREKMQTILCK